MNRQEQKEAARQERLENERLRLEHERQVAPEYRLLRYFEYDQLTDPGMRQTSKEFAELAHKMASTLPVDPMSEMCLNHLLIAKDAAVRAMLPEPKSVFDPDV